MALVISITYFYFPLLALPLLFIAYGIVRFIRHRRDGIGKRRYFSKHQIVKYCVILTIAFINLVHLTDTLQDDQELDLIARDLFYSCNALAWGFSLILLPFEYLRQLQLKWIGHRGFWVVECLVNIVLCILQTIQICTGYFTDQLDLQYAKAGLYGMLAVLSSILCIYAIFRPNDFIVQPNQSYYNVNQIEDFPSFLSGSDQDIQISIQVQNFKTKQKNNKIVAYYNIVTQVQQQKFSAWRTLQEASNVYQKILTSLSLQSFNIEYFPHFPQINSQLPIDKKLSILQNHLQELSQIEYMLPEMIEFLNIKGETALKLKQTYTKLQESVYASELNTSVRLSSSFNYVERMTRYEDLDSEFIELNTMLDVRIQGWNITQDKESYVEYQILWHYHPFDQKGEINKRYNQFLKLHIQLKKIIQPARLPKFPKKDFGFKSKRIDSEQTEYRRNLLDEYLRHICNDPAYICQPVLEFLDLNITPNQIIQYRAKLPIYNLIKPVKWQSELEESSQHFQNYIFTIQSNNNGTTSTSIVKHRYRYLNELNQFLKQRQQSQLLIQFYQNENVEMINLPKFPGKNIAKITSYDEIENRRSQLEQYIQQLLETPLIMEAYSLRLFLSNILIN